jgi:hypothetical protein
MPRVITKIWGISHLTTGCLQVVGVRYGTLNELRSDIAEGSESSPDEWSYIRDFDISFVPAYRCAHAGAGL